MIEIKPGLFVHACHVAAVKEIDEESCTVFMIGQSATDGGFLVERPALEVATDVAETLLEEEGDFEDGK